MNSFIENQNWRYATKKFDASKKISNEDLSTLKEAIRLSTSSYGLQPYKIFIVENEDLRNAIKPVAWGQSQIVDASHLFVFANVIDFNANHIDELIQNMATTRGLEISQIQGYGDFMKSKLLALPSDVLSTWTSKQSYLALANLMNAAAELKIDVTPMEGFEPEKVNEILGLNNLGLHASLLATVGYRSEEDATQHYKKVRKSTEELFITLK
jgi:nitroreductase